MFSKSYDGERTRIFYRFPKIKKKTYKTPLYTKRDGFYPRTGAFDRGNCATSAEREGPLCTPRWFFMKNCSIGGRFIYSKRIIIFTTIFYQPHCCRALGMKFCFFMHSVIDDCTIRHYPYYFMFYTHIHTHCVLS